MAIFLKEKLFKKYCLNNYHTEIHFNLKQFFSHLWKNLESAATKTVAADL